jgi:ABC-type lipoprotein export system ATPase subunit
LQIVELTGCSGVGKSTLLESLIPVYCGSKNLVTSDEEARYLITRQILKQNKSKWRFLFQSGIKVPLVNNFLCRKILDKEHKKELLKQYRNWEECLKVLFMKHSDPGKNLKSLLPLFCLALKDGIAVFLSKIFR